MKIDILDERGYSPALYGLSLSYNQPLDAMPRVAVRLASNENGENSFLEIIDIWIYIRAPRYWWQQFDRYRPGVSKLSASTMHTLTRRELAQPDFQRPIAAQTLTRLNQLIEVKDFEQLKTELPEGFLQERVVKLNYRSLRTILRQRRNHRLSEWRAFCEYVQAHVDHPEYLKLDVHDV